MIPRASLEAALPLTEQLDARGMFLRPILGTPLAALVTASRSDNNFNVALNGGGFEPDLSNIEFIANTQPSDGTLNAHDCAMDSLTAIGSKAVQDHMAFAKNVVAPTVQELVEDVLRHLAQATPSSLLGLEVKVFEPSPLLLSPAFAAAVRKYEGTPLDSPRMNVRMPDLAYADLVELCLAGGAAANSEIKEFLAAKGEGWLNRLWADVFQINPVDSGVRVRTFQEIISGEEGVDNAIGIFLLSRRLVDFAPPGVPMSASSLVQAMSEYRNQSAARLSRAISEQEMIAKAGTLVRRQAGREIMVNGSVYRKWLQAGGSNEVLFGNLLASQPAYTTAQVDARSKELKAGWDKHAALTNTVEQGRRIIRTKELLSQCFEEQVNKCAEGDRTLAGSRMEVVRLFDEMLQQVREEDLNDIYATALRLVCRSRFANTEAERILTSIERVKRDNPSLDIREAAAIAMIQYVAWWVSTQFKVETL